MLTSSSWSEAIGVHDPYEETFELKHSDTV